MMPGAWTMIFIYIASGVVSIDTDHRPLFFDSKRTCDAAARAINGGAEPNTIKPVRDVKFAALCRPTAIPIP